MNDNAAKAAWQACILHMLLICLGLVISYYLPERTVAGFVNPLMTSLPEWLEKMIKWDAHWYTYIAETGYTGQSIVFFPGLIVLIKMLAFFGINYSLAGLVVCNIFTCLSYFVFAAMLAEDYSERFVRRSVMAYAVFPMTFFLNSVYTEAVFLVFSFGCMYFCRQSKWPQAALCAALATLTRNIGVALAGYMLVEYIGRYGSRLYWKRVAWLLAAPAALAGFSVYNYYLLDDALAFVHAQKMWGREFSWPWTNLWNNYEMIRTGVSLFEPGVITDFILVLFTLFALIWLTANRERRIPGAYLVIAWVWFLIPLVSTSPIFPLYSMSRFVIVIFPIYIFLAGLPDWAFYGYLAAGGVLLAVLGACFTNWYWLG